MRTVLFHIDATSHRIDMPPTSALALGDAVWHVDAGGKARIGPIGTLTGGSPHADLARAGARTVNDPPCDRLSEWDPSPLADLLV